MAIKVKVEPSKFCVEVTRDGEVGKVYFKDIDKRTRINFYALAQVKDVRKSQALLLSYIDKLEGFEDESGKPLQVSDFFQLPVDIAHEVEQAFLSKCSDILLSGAKEDEGKLESQQSASPS